MLVTKIGLDELERIGEGALGMLRELVLRRDASPLTPFALVQLCSCALYAVNNAGPGTVESGQGTCTLQFNQVPSLPPSPTKDTAGLVGIAGRPVRLKLVGRVAGGGGF